MGFNSAFKGLNMAERLLQNSSAVLWTMQLVTSETRVRSQASLCNTFVGQLGLE
jgi:hypothetical protein